MKLKIKNADRDQTQTNLKKKKKKRGEENLFQNYQWYVFWYCHSFSNQSLKFEIPGIMVLFIE